MTNRLKGVNRSTLLKRSILGDHLSLLSNSIVLVSHCSRLYECPKRQADRQITFSVITHVSSLAINTGESKLSDHI